MWKINPTVKFAGVLIAALITAFSFSVKWNIIIILFCLVLLLISRANVKRILIVMIPASLAAISLFFAIYLNGRGDGGAAAGGHGFYQVAMNGADFSDALAVALRIYAYIFMGLLFVLTTKNNEFIYSLMQQGKLKPKFAYGMLAALNLVPVIMREMDQIRLAYKVRGCSVGALSLKPLFSALVNTMHWSESLAMAMESKGFDEDGVRTLYLEMKVRGIDILWAIVMIGLAVCGVLGL